MSVYEMINPSDEMTFEADDDNVAAVALILLGRGQVALEPLDGDTEREVLPIFLFGDVEAAVTAWLERRGIGELWAFVTEHRAAIVACLRSVVYGGARDRRAFDAMLDEIPSERHQAAREKWNDARRSSLSDWGTSALRYADHLELATCAR
jgi:hypothetical protein